MTGTDGTRAGHRYAPAMPDPGSAAADLVGETPPVALAVYAHPDDPEVSCGGTLARWAGAGCDVHILICTRGEKGSLDPSVDPDELALRRVEEMESSAAVLGVKVLDRLDHEDGELKGATSLRAEIVAVIRALRPDVVVCPDPTAVFFGDTYFNHVDHRAAGWAALDAVSPAAANPHYFPDAGPPHRVPEVMLSGTLEPNVWVDIGDTLAAKIDALYCHRSQLAEAGELLREALTHRAEDAGELAGVRYAEGFRRLSFGG